MADDIYTFCKALNFEPNHHQISLFNAVMRATYGKGPLKIAVKSGQGTGKTTGTTIVAAWRLIRNVNSMTVLTAPTARQCREIWLAEFRRVLKAADPFIQQLFEVTGTKVKIAKMPEWGVKTVTATDSERAQGFHAKNMDIIVEEASGVDRGIIEQFKGTASNPNCLFLMIGNPNTRDCAFFDCFNSQRNEWVNLTFNAEETQKSDYFDPKRNEDIAREFGRDSDVYRIRVLGEFPHADANCVMSTEEVERCFDMSRLVDAVRQPKMDGSSPAKQFGLDFARFGSDKSVVYRRSGNAIVDKATFSHADPSEAVLAAFNMQHKSGWKDSECVYVADAGGMGQGVMQRFYDANKQVFEFHNNGTAMESDKYANKITEGWFTLAQRLRTIPCVLPSDMILLRQLTNRQYFIDKKGKMILEGKDDYMKRGHESPDEADALVMAMYDSAHVSAQISSRSDRQGGPKVWTAQSVRNRR